MKMVEPEHVLTPPDYSDERDVQAFVERLQKETNIPGALRILRAARIIANHLRRVDQLKTSVTAWIEAYNLDRGKVLANSSYRDQTQRLEARRFYTKLSNEVLDVYMKIFGFKDVQTDVTHSRLQVLETLINAHTQLHEGQHVSSKR